MFPTKEKSNPFFEAISIACVTPNELCISIDMIKFRTKQPITTLLSLETPARTVDPGKPFVVPSMLHLIQEII